MSRLAKFLPHNPMAGQNSASRQSPQATVHERESRPIPDEARMPPGLRRISASPKALGDSDVVDV